MAGTLICLYSECRKEFIPEKKGMKYCCPECRTIATRIRARELERKRKEEKAKISKKATVGDIEREARKRGMHYGQYVAMMEMKKGVQNV